MDIDDKIRRGVRIVGWAMLVIVLSPVVIVLAVRNLPPNAERRAALHVLHQPNPPVRGRDGSDAAWLLPYDVPADRQAETAARLRKYLVRYDDLTVEHRDAEAQALPDPREQLKAFPAFEEKPAWLCEDRGLGCLAAVRLDPPAAAAAVQANAAGLAAVARLGEFDGTRSGLPPSLTQQVPHWGGFRRLLLTRAALQFAQGDQHEAVAGVCRQLAGWRRLGADTDTLIANMVAAAYARQDLQLLSEMLAELPPDTPLPPDCEAALAAVRPAELDLCQAMRTEFLGVEALYLRQMEAGTKPEGRKFVRAAVGREHAAAVIAPAYAAYCGETVHRVAAADQPAASAHPPQARCALVERIGDPIGCILAEASPDFIKYQDRRTDLAAQIALMRAVAWARTQGVRTQAAFDARPASLGLRRQVQVSADGTEVSIPLFDRYKGKRFALRLAAPARG